MTITNPNWSRATRGLTLIEAALALAIAGAMMVGSIQGLDSYTKTTKVQTAASKLKRLNAAAALYAQDHFSTLTTGSQNVFDISILDPYYAGNLENDTFGNEYRLATRTEVTESTDPVTGLPKTLTALKLLIVAFDPDDDGLNDLDTKPMLRIDLANTAGPRAGFIAFDDNLCIDEDGDSRRKNDICGAYGGFSFSPSDWPTNSLRGAKYVSLVNEAKSQQENALLHRLPNSDSELHTMHTDLDLGGNSIRNTRIITGNNLIEMDGAVARARNDEGHVTFDSNGEIHLSTAANNIVMHGDDSWDPYRINTRRRGIFIGDDSDELIVGDRSEITVSAPTDTTSYTYAMNETAPYGSGDLLTSRVFADEVRSTEINSLLKAPQDPLKIQDFSKGEVIIGQRGRYRPVVGLGDPDEQPIYELSDGMLTTGHLKVQDLTCADCGGTLSEILPRWRLMGTYLVENNTTYKDVPKPNCIMNRRDTSTRNAVGSRHKEYQETDVDERYIPNIILFPKQARKEQNSRGRFNIQLEAEDIGSSWRVRTNFNDDNVLVEATALTYCVFVGGPDDKLDPVNPTNAIHVTRKGTTWTALPP